jgi:restriction system protein
MAVPDYQTIMRPLMDYASDRAEHTSREAVEVLATKFVLSIEDRRELIPSGQEAKFDNRVGWAITYLKKAGLLERTGRARFRITNRGIELLKSHHGSITSKVLEQFPEFLEFKKRTPRTNYRSNEDSSLEDVNAVVELHQTPQEILETSYQLLRKNLAQELLEKVKTSPPRFFERLVVDLLVSCSSGCKTHFNMKVTVCYLGVWDTVAHDRMQVRR